MANEGQKNQKLRGLKTGLKTARAELSWATLHGRRQLGTELGTEGVDSEGQSGTRVSAPSLTYLGLYAPKLVA